MTGTKKWVAIGVLIFALAAHLYAQDAPMEEEELLTGAVETRPFTKGGLDGGGFTFIDGNAYVQLQLQPEIPIGKLGLGLDLVVLYNPFAEGSEPDSSPKMAKTGTALARGCGSFAISVTGNRMSRSISVSGSWTI